MYIHPYHKQDSNPWFHCSNGKNKYKPYTMQPPWMAHLWTTLQHFIKLHCRSEYTLVQDRIHCIVSTISTCNVVTKYFHQNQVTLPHIQISVTFSSHFFSKGKDALYVISTIADSVKKNLRATCSSQVAFPTTRGFQKHRCLTFKRRIKSHLPFAGIIRSSPYSPRFQDNG